MKSAEIDLPSAIWDQHVADLGKTGSGKTHTAKWLVEQHVARGSRVCVLDPIKTDWSGMASSASGKSAGLPFCILGGPKQHVPLPGRSGAAVGELVATGAMPLSILDMSELGPKEHAQFFIDFAETLTQKMSGVLVLVMEEADVFAPKDRFGTEKENMRLYWSSRIARTGRSKGIRLILACTRIQKIHNDMLGSCEVLVAHKFTMPADRKPVIKWLELNADKEVVKEIGGTLSSLKAGEAWVCHPASDFIKRVQFPRIHTYDNSATPSGDARASDVKTATIDVESIRAKLGEVIQEALANDPAVLKDEIAKLKRELTSATRKAPDANATMELRKTVNDLSHELDHSRSQNARLISELTSIAKAADGAARALRSPERPPTKPRTMTNPGTSSAGGGIAFVGPMRVLSRDEYMAESAPVRGRSESASIEGGAIPSGELAILRAVAQYTDRGGATRSQLSALTGYKKSSRNSYISRLCGRGLISISDGDVLSATAEGVQALGEGFEHLPTGDALQRYWLERLPEGEAGILRIVLDAYPESVSRQEVGERSGYKKSSRNSYISRLVGKKLISATTAACRAEDVMFE